MFDEDSVFGSLGSLIGRFRGTGVTFTEILAVVAIPPSGAAAGETEALSA